MRLVRVDVPANGFQAAPRVRAVGDDESRARIEFGVECGHVRELPLY